MYIESSPILDVVDEYTHFSAAPFLLNSSTTTIWTLFMEIWSLIYACLHNRILIDELFAFGDQFVYFCKISNINASISGVESQNSLGFGDRYRQPLLISYRKLKLAYTLLNRDILLAMSFKYMNETLRRELIFISSLVFCDLPQMRSAGDDAIPCPKLLARVTAARESQQKMDTIMSRLPLNGALFHTIHAA